MWGGACFSGSPIFGFLYINIYTVRRRTERPNSTYGESLILAGQPEPRPPSQGVVPPADPNFGGSHLLMRTRFDVE